MATSYSMRWARRRSCIAHRASVPANRRVPGQRRGSLTLDSAQGRPELVEGRKVDEDVAVPRFARNASKRKVCAIEALDLVHLRRRQQAAVEAVGPRVIRALDAAGKRAGRLGAEPRAAMPADVVMRAHRSVRPRARRARSRRATSRRMNAPGRPTDRRGPRPATCARTGDPSRRQTTTDRRRRAPAAWCAAPAAKLASAHREFMIQPARPERVERTRRSTSRRASSLPTPCHLPDFQRALVDLACRRTERG